MKNRARNSGNKLDQLTTCQSCLGDCCNNLLQQQACCHIAGVCTRRHLLSRRRQLSLIHVCCPPISISLIALTWEFPCGAASSTPFLSKLWPDFPDYLLYPHTYQQINKPKKTLWIIEASARSDSFSRLKYVKYDMPDLQISGFALINSLKSNNLLPRSVMHGQSLSNVVFPTGHRAACLVGQAGCPITNYSWEKVKSTY